MAVNDGAVSDQRQAVGEHRLVLGREAGDDVGADGDVAPRLDPLDDPHGVGPAVAALHALEDHVVARLQREVEMRHHPWLADDQVEQPLVDLDAVDR